MKSTRGLCICETNYTRVAVTVRVCCWPGRGAGGGAVVWLLPDCVGAVRSSVVGL